MYGDFFDLILSRIRQYPCSFYSLCQSAPWCHSSLTLADHCYSAHWVIAQNLAQLCKNYITLHVISWDLAQWHHNNRACGHMAHGCSTFGNIISFSMNGSNALGEQYLMTSLKIWVPPLPTQSFSARFLKYPEIEQKVLIRILMEFGLRY